MQITENVAQLRPQNYEIKISILLSMPLINGLSAHSHRFPRCEWVLAILSRQEFRWGPMSMSESGEHSQGKCLKKYFFLFFLTLLWSTNFLLPKVHSIFTTCFAAWLILQICIFVASSTLFAQWLHCGHCCPTCVLIFLLFIASGKFLTF